MKRAFKRLIPLLLAVGIIASIGWYLFVYDRAFTRDMLIQQARFFDAQGNPKITAMLYNLAYQYTGQDEDVAIELANQYKSDGNYTKAEFTLTNAIADGGTVDLYIALCKTYVEQDKLLDAVAMLDNIGDPDIRMQLDRLRPAAPTADPAPGYYTEYISVSLTTQEGTLYCTTDGEYPSIADAPCTEPIKLPGGETVIYALTVADNGMVSPLSILGYTVGGVIEEAIFEDPAVELAIREELGVDSDEVLMTDQLWDITRFTVPEDAHSLNDLALLPYLQSLTISGMKPESLSDLSSLAELTELHMTDCRFPVEDLKIIAALPMLEKLTLSGCNLSTISDLSGAMKLNYLDLSENTLRNLDPLIPMATLQELYLQHNAVTSLEALSALTNLRKLDVSFNSVTSLSVLASCPSLSWINAGNNLITSPAGAENIAALSHLDLDHNQLTDVSILGSCNNLTELNISNNAIADISALANLTGLTALNCSYNALTALPAWPEGSALSILEASYNQIESVEPLRKLEELTYVYMDYNKLTTVDPIAECYRLVMVNVYGNEIEDVSKLNEHNIIVNYDPT